MDAVAVEYVVARRVLATLGGRRPMLKAARDARSARPWVRCYSPRIPHDKVTQWQSTVIRPCQRAIIAGEQRASTPLSRTKCAPE